MNKINYVIKSSLLFLASQYLIITPKTLRNCHTCITACEDVCQFRDIICCLDRDFEKVKNPSF